ncbi:hypothetical protein [Thauera phenolivorans]|uniref:hypothetical protein n=1 Tax=Thauera phenolivorans TaxID=1792543 RepID=UPI001301620A|nr:hypothetical protein [Thauera phenolivorans]
MGLEAELAGQLAPLGADAPIPTLRALARPELECGAAISQRLATGSPASPPLTASQQAWLGELKR